MMAAILYLAFIRNRDLVIEAAGANLDNAVRQLRGSLIGSTRRLRREVIGMASAPAIEEAVSPLGRPRSIILADSILEQARRASRQYVAIALWSSDGKLIIATGDTDIAQSRRPSGIELQGSSLDTADVMFTPLTTQGDSVLYSVVGTVLGAGGSTQGYIVATRRLGSNPATPALLGGMIGPAARVLLGNADGDTWTDFTRRVHGISVPADTSEHSYQDVNGVMRLHAAISVPDTPWRVVADVPQSWATTTATRFVVDMLTMALVFIAVGGVIIWAATRRALMPLKDITAGVVRIARGEGAVTLRESNDDELGQLAVAFNSMSAQIEGSSRELRSRAEALEQSYHQLQESERRYRVLLDHLPDGVMVHRNGQIIFANQSCARVLALESSDALVGRSVLDFVDDDQRAIVNERIDGVQGRGASAPTRETMLRRPDGGRLLVEATSMPLHMGGITVVQTILHDITERQALEAQLRHSQKMDAVGRLAGGVAHDFNNILTVIDAHADFAMRADEPEAARLEDIDAIRRASASAAQLTKQLLAFSRKQAISPRTLNLSRAVKNVTKMLERLLGESIAVVTRLADDLWSARADPTYIEQIIVNLSVNARDAMPDGGTLTISTANMGINEETRAASGELIPAGDYVSLAIEDTGVGMSDEIKAKVFEPFFTTKKPGRGTGLGLATVYGIVKQAGGYIWLYSEPGLGSTFRILLPRYTGPEEAPPLMATGEHRAALLSARILLVEDQDAVRAALCRATQRAGFAVSEASNVTEARHLLNTPGAGFDLIVTDMVMPGETGADLARDAAVVDRGIPVIIMSGYSEEFTNREWRLPPNASFLEKPVRPADLIRLITSLLGPG